MQPPGGGITAETGSILSIFLEFRIKNKPKYCQITSLSPSYRVYFSQEESVAGLMSEVCPFLKEMKRRDRDPLRSLV